MPDGPPSRKPLVAANWKMTKTVAETEDFLERFVGSIGDLGGVEVVLCPPYTSLPAATDRARRSPIAIVAQNVHEAESGAFTGEVSIPMLAELGAAGSIVGHSERRQLFGETEAVLARQLEADLATIDAEAIGRIVIAYEPIWAIGTGRTATPEQAQEAVAFVRGLVAGHGAEAAEAVRILYGGSVKPANAAELFAQPDIDGGLVGGASLDPDDFLAICEAAR